MRTWMVQPFHDGAADLRAAFVDRVAGDRRTDLDRFVWDWWHVAGQYTYLRTPARRFFGGAWHPLATALREWGDRVLGCGRFSEPWLSIYVHGCRQELHADVPQGPWAFVYSLTDTAASHFTGGETILLRPSTLDHWASFDPMRPLEVDDLVERIPVRFDQLTVFDARVPHGVAVVEGTLDPVHARVVVHGWFLPPRLAVHGALGAAAVEPAVAAIRGRWVTRLGGLGGAFTGTACWRVSILPSGAVGGVDRLPDTLVATGSERSASASGVLDATTAELTAVRWPPAAGPTTLVLPLIAGVR